MHQPNSENAVIHLECHGIHMFHCLHCDFGAKEIDEVRRHMGEKHPSKLLYLSVRKLRNSQCREDDIDATIILDVARAMSTHFNIRWCPYREEEINFMDAPLRSTIKNRANQPAPAVIGQSGNIDGLLMTHRLRKSYDIFMTLNDFEKQYH